MNETCLWVIDSRKKGLDPETFRCTPQSDVMCAPCLHRFGRRRNALGVQP